MAYAEPNERLNSVTGLPAPLRIFCTWPAETGEGVARRLVSRAASSRSVRYSLAWAPGTTCSPSRRGHQIAAQLETSRFRRLASHRPYKS